MKNRICIIILILGIVSCSSSDKALNNTYEFISKYTTVVTVGGVVGITERTFEVGEIYLGTDKGGKTITIRIAEHSKLNDNCPNSWCYQEALEIPREFLRIIN